jgi:hypothetical protein
MAAPSFGGSLWWLGSHINPVGLAVCKCPNVARGYKKESPAEDLPLGQSGFSVVATAT